MSPSRASATSSAVTARERSRPALRSKQVSQASAFTSHGWPRVWVQIASCASGVNACPVSPVCWPSRASVSSCVKSPSRSDFATMLKGLLVERMR